MEERRLSDDEIQELFVAVLTGGRPSRSAVRLIARFVDGPGLGNRIKALGVLAIAGDEVERQRAWSGLRKILIESAMSLSPQEKFNLVFVLMQCLDDEHLSEPQFREYVYEAAGDASAPVRCNALVILRGLARVADERALALLRLALHDQDESVRTNARTFLADSATTGTNL
jgi:hypothetical protein